MNALLTAGHVCGW